MIFEEDLTILMKTIERISKGLKKSVDTSFLIDITEQVEKELNLEKRHKLKDFLKKELQEIEMKSEIKETTNNAFSLLVIFFNAAIFPSLPTAL